MKLLFDANVSHKLVRDLASEYPGSIHVRDVGLRGGEDRQIWHHARTHGFAITTYRGRSTFRRGRRSDSSTMIACGYRHEERQTLLRWVADSKVGLPIETPAAIAFASKFPPPQTPVRDRPTHVIKTVLATADGAIMSAQFNYMYANESRSEHVASLEEVRAWAAETGYEWWAFWVTAIGLIGMVASSGLDWRERLKAEGGQPVRDVSLNAGKDA